MTGAKRCLKTGPRYSQHQPWRVVGQQKANYQDFGLRGEQCCCGKGCHKQATINGKINHKAELHQHYIEAAQLALLNKDPLCNEGGCIMTFCQTLDLVGVNEEDRHLQIDKAANEEGTGIPVDLGPCAWNLDPAPLRIPGWQGHEKPLSSLIFA